MKRVWNEKSDNENHENRTAAREFSIAEATFGYGANKDFCSKGMRKKFTDPYQVFTEVDKVLKYP